MTDRIRKGLLPEGIRDCLPPQAEAADGLMRGILDHMAAHGYERVRPPLIEFEASLLGRIGATRSQDMLRLIDPVSQNMLALRPDMTGQVGRIASTRLAHLARPLRLSYGGVVLRMRGTALHPEREMLQAGAELIGRCDPPAIVEALQLALFILQDMGVEDISVDLTLPALVDELAQGQWPLQDDRATVMACLTERRISDLDALGLGDTYGALAAAAGPAAATFARLHDLQLAGRAGQMVADARTVAQALGPDVTLTLDPVDQHSLSMRGWIGFAIFSARMRREICRGGAYEIVRPDGDREQAVGFSLYLDDLVDHGLGQVAIKRVFLPMGTPAHVGQALREQGWRTVAALDEQARAVDQRCDHVWDGARVVPVQA